MEFIDAQFEAYLQEELKIKRTLHSYHDTRIHACLYFIAPTGHSLKSLDLVTMKKLDSKVSRFGPNCMTISTLIQFTIIKPKIEFSNTFCLSSANCYLVLLLLLIIIILLDYYILKIVFYLPNILYAICGSALFSVWLCRAVFKCGLLSIQLMAMPCLMSLELCRWSQWRSAVLYCILFHLSVLHRLP